MTRLAPISGRKLCKILEKLGFEKIYGKGSHVRFRHPDGRREQLCLCMEMKRLYWAVE